MDYIQRQLHNSINKMQRKEGAAASTIAGLYNVLFQYQLYLIFACLWDKLEPEMTMKEKANYLCDMQRASLGKILENIERLSRKDPTVMSLPKTFYSKMREFIAARNASTGHGVLIPGMQNSEYAKLAELYAQVDQTIGDLRIPILARDCIFYYLPTETSHQVVVFDDHDYDYQNLSLLWLRELGIRSRELHYRVEEGDCYRISPFILCREERNGDTPALYCYQKYDLRTGVFTYNKYSDLVENATLQETFKDYLMSFGEEHVHTVLRINGVICNKFENNYDYFVTTKPISSYEQKVKEFLISGRSNTCLTIRGGGGIGKTALVQYVCTKNILEPSNAGNIHYLVFCSAKDREFALGATTHAEIRTIQDESVVHGYEDIIRTIAWVLGHDTPLQTEEDIRDVENVLLRTSGVLLIVDDFETLEEVDKKRIVALSNRLDVTKHKMIVTTRSQYNMGGEEYYIEGLDRDQTIAFMRARFQSKDYSERQRAQFDTFVKDKEIKEQIYTFTRGLPLRAIQLGHLLELNNFSTKSLRMTDKETTQEFLFGRLYDYFGTATAKALFLIVATFVQFGNDKIAHTDLQTMYRLLCKRMNDAGVDYERDRDELSKLNVIRVETDYVTMSGNISNGMIRHCQDALIKQQEVPYRIFDNTLFKSIMEIGMKEGVRAYCERTDAIIDPAFVAVFVYENALTYTNDIRFAILEKYIARVCSDVDAVRDIYLDACRYFDVSLVRERFICYQRKYRFRIPEIAEEETVSVDVIETSSIDDLERIIDELKDKQDEIDNFILSRKKRQLTQGYQRTMIQKIRGELLSICRIKLAAALALPVEGREEKLQELMEEMDEISCTREFNLRDNEQYIQLQSILRTR